MGNIHFVFPTADLEQKVLDFKHCFYSRGERTIYGSYKLDVDRYSYNEWLNIIERNSKKETADSRFGISDTFFAVNENEKIVGIINIRYNQPDFYKDSGHIGYSVLPTMRKKGYATEMLHMALEKEREHGLSEVKLVCMADNIGSKKTILKCGGVLNRSFGPDDAKREEYIIKL